MKRLVLAASVGLILSACASVHKPSASQPVAMGETGAIGRSALPPSQRKRSPYAPAQEDSTKRGHYVRGGRYKPGVADNVPGYIPDVGAIPEPDVIDEPRSRYGNRSPYQVLGKSYAVRDSAKGYIERGEASYYGGKFHGRRTSNMEVYDMYAFTAAHRSLPLPSFARVTNLDNGKSVVVRVNDRGPFHDDRIIDLSYAAAVKLGYREQGVAQVEVRGLSAGENAQHRYDALALTKTPASTSASSAKSAIATSASTAPARAVSVPTESIPTASVPAASVPTKLASARKPAAALPPGVRIATGQPTRLAKGVPASAPVAAANTTPSASTAMDKLVHLLPVAAANAGERPTLASSSFAARTGASSRNPRQAGPWPSAANAMSARTTARAAQPAAAAPAGVNSSAAKPVPGREWRFNMLQDGKAMSADEFDAWMKARRARVATGKAGEPVLASVAGTTALPLGPQLPSPAAAAAAVATAVPSDSGQVILQVASFGNATNAGHAMTMLRNANIGSAQIRDAVVDGKPYWRVRIGPVDATKAPDIASRVVALGFDQPHRVRE